ncbi:MAG TPA: hypothetical protein DD727_04810 [Clostridiales bacterium]|nr:hypothetical protein [Clostridiales bacterium]
MENLTQDVQILRDLAKQYKEITAKPIQQERRELWRRHNSLQPTRPPIYIRAFAWGEILDPSCLKCQDPFFRSYEQFFHMMFYRDTLPDDVIAEPWVTVPAVRRHASSDNTPWGVHATRISSGVRGGAAKYDPPIKEPEDILKLVKPRHIIDEEATRQRVEKVRDAIGDIIEVNVGRHPVLWGHSAVISTDLAMLRGLEQIMWDMTDRPEWLHQLLGILRDGILGVHEEAEKAGDLQLADHDNQAVSYSQELKDPKANSGAVKRRDLWHFFHSQEYALISPEMFDEFMLHYQIPIMEKYGLVSYGCCEDLTRKIPYLKKIPNLRRIAVTPWADKRRCAEQIGRDYVLSWRPSPTDAVSFGLDPAAVRRTVEEARDIFQENGNIWDITLKDVETVQGDAKRVQEWTRIVREVVESC